MLRPRRPRAHPGCPRGHRSPYRANRAPTRPTGLLPARSADPAPRRQVPPAQRTPPEIPRLGPRERGRRLLGELRAQIARFVILPSDAGAGCGNAVGGGDPPSGRLAARAASGGGRPGQAVRQVPPAGRAHRDRPQAGADGQLHPGGGLPLHHRGAAHAAGGRGRHDLRQPEDGREERGDARPAQRRTPARPLRPAGRRQRPHPAQLPHLRHGRHRRYRRPPRHDHGPVHRDPDAPPCRRRTRLPFRTKRDSPALHAMRDRIARWTKPLADHGRDLEPEHAGRGPRGRHLGTAGHHRRPRRRPLAPPCPAGVRAHRRPRSRDRGGPPSGARILADIRRIFFAAATPTA